MGKPEHARVGDRMSTGKSRRAGIHATQRDPTFELYLSTRPLWFLTIETTVGAGNENRRS